MVTLPEMLWARNTTPAPAAPPAVPGYTTASGRRHGCVNEPPRQLNGVL